MPKLITIVANTTAEEFRGILDNITGALENFQVKSVSEADGGVVVQLTEAVIKE